VFPREDLLLENLGAPAFIDPGDLEYLRRIHVRVLTSAHDRDAPDHALVYLGVMRSHRREREREEGASDGLVSRSDKWWLWGKAMGDRKYLDRGVDGIVDLDGRRLALALFWRGQHLSRGMDDEEEKERVACYFACQRVSALVVLLRTRR
jgi:hypothetical protein